MPGVIVLSNDFRPMAAKVLESKIAIESVLPLIMSRMKSQATEKRVSSLWLVYSFSKCLFYDRNPNKAPAATAEPITPATFGPIACMRRKL